MGGARTLQFDSFNAPDGTLITDRATDSGHLWVNTLPGLPLNSSLSIDSNQRMTYADPGASSTAGHMVCHSRLRRRNGRVSATYVRVGPGQTSQEFCNLLLRSFVVPRLEYVNVRYGLTVSSTLFNTISRNTIVIGGNISFVFTQDQLYQVVVDFRGPVVSLFIDGVLISRQESAWLRAPRGYMCGTRIDLVAGIVSCPLRLDNWAASR